MAATTTAGNMVTTDHNLDGLNFLLDEQLYLKMYHLL